METIINFANGVKKTYSTEENDTYRFYHCGEHVKAYALCDELKRQGRDAVADFGRFGWYVREKKE